MLNGEGNENSKKITTIGPISKIADYNVKFPSCTFYRGNVPCVPVRFFFSLPLIFTLVTAGISHCHYTKTFMFFFQRNSSPLFFISRSSSFSVIHISVDIKILSRKTDSALFFWVATRFTANTRECLKWEILPWLAWLSSPCADDSLP